ncbi:MAG: hypothetical protein ABSF52_20435 [Syntrophobacteraceae bacterium]
MKSVGEIIICTMPLRDVSEMIANAGSKFDEQGDLRDEKGEEVIRLFLIRLVEWPMYFAQSKDWNEAA